MVNWRLLGATLAFEGGALATISIVSITTHSVPIPLILLPFFWPLVLVFLVKDDGPRKPRDVKKKNEPKETDHSESTCSACGSSITDKAAPVANNGTDGG
jgi:hypothetical protein